MSAPFTLTTDARAVGGWRRAAQAVVTGIDRAAASVTDGRRPVAEQLAERKLWGYLQGGAPAVELPTPTLGLSFDLDYQEDTDALPGLVDAVARVDARMTLFSIGKLVEADPAPYRAALDAGHELGNHTWSHPDNPVLNPDREFWDLSVDEMRDEVLRAQEVFDEHLGVRPSGFRTPHFKDAHRMLEALEPVDEITWLSTTLATTTPTGLPYHPSRGTVLGHRSHLVEPRDRAHRSRLLQLPLTACPEHRWSPFCSYHSWRGPHRPEMGQGFHLDLGEVVTLWQRMLEAQRDSGYALVYLDPKDVMRDRDTTEAFVQMLASAVGAGWDVTSVGELASRWTAASAERDRSAVAS